MSIKSLYSNEEEEWKNTEEYDITRLHDANPTHLSTKNNEGQLPIHCAIAAADISVIKKMHELNEDGVSVKEGNLSWTALHLAVYLGRDDLVPFLISVYSPAAKLSDSEGQLPIDIAKATDDDTNEVKQSKGHHKQQFPRNVSLRCAHAGLSGLQGGRNRRLRWSRGRGGGGEAATSTVAPSSPS